MTRIFRVQIIVWSRNSLPACKYYGFSCGIIGNNGPIDPNGANKATQFFQLCDQSRTPLIFLHNTTGYIVGTESEQAGMIKHGSKMIQAVTNVRVPRLSLYVGASYGAGNYGMCGMSYDLIFFRLAKCSDQCHGLGVSRQYNAPGKRSCCNKKRQAINRYRS